MSRGNSGFAPPPRADWGAIASKLVQMMSRVLAARSERIAKHKASMLRKPGRYYSNSNNNYDDDVFVSDKFNNVYIGVQIPERYVYSGTVVKCLILFSPDRLSLRNDDTPSIPFAYKYSDRTSSYSANSTAARKMHAPTAAWQTFMTAMTAELLEKSKPVPDDTWIRAGALLAPNNVKSMLDRATKRQMSPQSEPWTRHYRQMIVSHPQLRHRLRGLRDPFSDRYGSNGGAPGSKPKLFAQHPRKSEVERMIQHWTQSNGYRLVQAFRREGPGKVSNSNKVSTFKLDYAMALYMNKFALRAPQLPPKMRNVATGSATPVLYRGVKMSRAQLNAFLSSGRHTDAGYMAFTRSPAYAMTFVSERPSNEASDIAVVFRLSTANVKRGTPWIWFAAALETKGVLPKNLRGNPYPQPKLPPNIRRNDDRTYVRGEPLAFRRNFVKSSIDSEYEVVLPPGIVSVLSRKITTTKTAWGDKILQVDVAYAPDRAATSLWTNTAQGGTRTMRIV